MPRVKFTESTKIRALREARRLLQSFGFNGFSFQDIADAIGIRKPSLYDHFESKEQLGRDLVDNYAETFRIWTETVADLTPLAKIGALFEVFFAFSRHEKQICPLSAFSADLNSLPKSLRKPLAKACQFQTAWLIEAIEAGQKQKTIRTDLKSEALARLVQAAGLGSQLLARTGDDPESIRLAKENLLRLIRKI